MITAAINHFQNLLLTFAGAAKRIVDAGWPAVLNFTVKPADDSTVRTQVGEPALVK